MPSLVCKRFLLVSAVCALAAGVASFGAVPAGAVVGKIHGRGVGITPANGQGGSSLVRALARRRAGGGGAAGLAQGFDVPPLGGKPLEWQGGPVMHSVTAHVVYWDPNKEFSSTTKGIVDGFFANAAHDSGAATNVFAVAGQYKDGTGHAAYNLTSTASLVDEDSFPASGCTAPNGPFADPGSYTTCLEDSQLQTELSSFIAAKKLPVGSTQMYLLLLPHKVATCLPEEIEFELGVEEQVCSNNVFCAYHSSINPAEASEVIYADIPFSLLDSTFAKGCQDDGHNSNLQQPNPDNAGGKNTETRFADVALKYISHEFIEADTDPLVGAQTAWVDEFGQEIGDKCNGVHGPSNGLGKDPNAFLPVLGGSFSEDNLFDQSINGGHYYIQSEWDNGAKACEMKPLELTATSFGPTAGTAGAPISFSAAGDPYGGFEPTWSFGDGTEGVGAKVAHTYAAAGNFTVTMTPKDNLTGSTGPAVIHTVTVTAPTPAVPVAPVVPTAPATTSTVTTPPPAPNSTFTATASTNAKTGAVTFSTAVQNPGTLTWLATFQNGKFGAFVAARHCKRGQIKLAGKCLPATITFSKGSKAVSAAGSVTITLKPSSSALKALKNALKHRKGVPVTIVFKFQSSLGGSPTTRTQTVTVKLKK